MDETATNYNPNATISNGTCTYQPKVTMLEPADGAVFYGDGNITFRWKVENIAEGFIPKICFDKGPNPYDGGVEFCETLELNATSYTHYFSYVWQMVSKW
jgi:hypothetical protein